MLHSHILIPTDGSELAERAIEQGLALARLWGARVTLLRVVQPLQQARGESLSWHSALQAYERAAQAQITQWLAQEAGRISSTGLSCDAVTVISARPHDAIVNLAHTQGCDLIVIASHGRSGLPAMLLGSVVSAVLRHTRLSVLVCR